MGRDREVGMAIADVVSGKVTEPLGIRALVAERTVEPDDVSTWASVTARAWSI